MICWLQLNHCATLLKGTIIIQKLNTILCNKCCNVFFQMNLNNKHLCSSESSRSYPTDRSSSGWPWPWPAPELWPISASPPLCWLSNGKCAPRCSEQYCRRLLCRCALWPGWWCHDMYGPSPPVSYHERRRQEQPKRGGETGKEMEVLVHSGIKTDTKNNKKKRERERENFQ